MQQQIKLAQEFRQLNQQGPFLLANAWDIASARIFSKAGFPALQKKRIKGVSIAILLTPP